MNPDDRMTSIEIMWYNRALSIMSKLTSPVREFVIFDQLDNCPPLNAFISVARVLMVHPLLHEYVLWSPHAKAYDVSIVLSRSYEQQIKWVKRWGLSRQVLVLRDAGLTLPDYKPTRAKRKRRLVITQGLSNKKMKP